MELPFQFTHRVEENLFQTSRSEICGGYSKNERHNWGLWAFRDLTAARNQTSTETWTRPPTWRVFHCLLLSIWSYKRYELTHGICFSGSDILFQCLQMVNGQEVIARSPFWAHD